MWICEQFLHSVIQNIAPMSWTKDTHFCWNISLVEFLQNLHCFSRMTSSPLSKRWSAQGRRWYFLYCSLVALKVCSSFLPPLVAKPVGTVKVKHPQSCTVLIQGSTDHAIAQMKENVLRTFTFWQFPTSLFFDIVGFPGCHQGWLESCTELRGGWGEKTKCKQNCGFWLSWIGLKRGEESLDILSLLSWHVCLWEFHHSSLVGSAGCRQLCLAPEHSRPHVLYRGWKRKKTCDLLNHQLRSCNDCSDVVVQAFWLLTERRGSPEKADSNPCNLDH